MKGSCPNQKGLGFYAYIKFGPRLGPTFLCLQPKLFSVFCSVFSSNLCIGNKATVIKLARNCYYNHHIAIMVVRGE